MITDIEFQNRGDTLRLAPWLDMPLLRETLKKKLAEELQSRHGWMLGFVGDYVDDLQSFCDGERDRIPRCNQAESFVWSVIIELFPIANDESLEQAVPHIRTHIMQLGTWQRSRRGGSPEETPPEKLRPTHRPSPVVLEEDDDYEDDYEDEDMDF